MNENSIDSSPLSWSAEILQTRYDAQYSKNGETSQKWIVFPCGFKILFNKNFENVDFIFWSFNTSPKNCTFFAKFQLSQRYRGASTVKIGDYGSDSQCLTDDCSRLLSFRT